MERALELAYNAVGRTSPNPLVGAVIVKNNRIVGQGWHRKAGTPHAEVHALRQAGELAKDAEVYVTLEPCSHYGKTPPCSKALIEAGVKRVYIGMVDPNPLVAGRGIKMLMDAGIEVSVCDGMLKQKAQQLNEVFLKWITTKLPFTVVKSAMTLDGKIATADDDTRWITGSEARHRVHLMRDIYDGILIGIGTALKDDPLLTTRLSTGGKNPIRIIVDSKARLPLDSQVITDKAAKTIVAVTDLADTTKIAALRDAGAEVWELPARNSHVDLKALWQKLGEERICSVMVEGGAAINDALAQEQLIDKVCMFVAPKIIGGQAAPTPFGGMGVSLLRDAMLLDNVTVESIGRDFLFTGYVRKAGDA